MSKEEGRAESVVYASQLALANFSEQAAIHLPICSMPALTSRITAATASYTPSSRRAHHSMSVPLPVPFVTTNTHPSKLGFACLPPKFDNDKINFSRRARQDAHESLSLKSSTTKDRSKASNTLSHTADRTFKASVLIAPTPPKTASINSTIGTVIVSRVPRMDSAQRPLNVDKIQID